MAEKALRKLEDQLSCSVCLDTYTDPKQLQCHHVYCKKCLVKLVIRDEQGQLILTCPNCRHVTPVPANGVAGLQSAFNISNLLEIIEEHKSSGQQDAPKVEETGTTSPHLASPSWSTLYCQEHGDKEAELYCETCAETICFKCAIKGEKHHSHEYLDLNKAFEKYEREITASLKPMEKQVENIKQVLAEVDTCSGEIHEQEADIEATVHETFQRLHDTLEARKSDLLGQLHQVTQRKLKRLATQRDQIETSLARLSSCLGFVKESLRESSKGKVLRMKATMVKRMKEMSFSDISKFDVEADLNFLRSSNIEAFSEDYGQISYQPNLLASSKCYISGTCDLMKTGRKSTLELQAIGTTNRPWRNQIESINCDLVSEIDTHSITKGRATRKGLSQYEIEIQPAIKGKHQLHIKVNGEHIKASPFQVTVTSAVEELDAPFFALEDFPLYPWGIAVNRAGNLVISESRREHCVFVFSPVGDHFLSFGDFGSGRGQFRYPSGVAVDDKDDIFVVDNNNHRIQKFTSEGQFLAEAGSEGSDPLRFHYPSGIAFNPSNKKLYVSDGNHQIQVLNTDLTFSSMFEEKGSEQAQFNYPRGVAADSEGNVYVADSRNSRIQVFTAEGEFIRMFGKHGTERGELYGPIGVAIDASNNVFVSDMDNCCISVFTTDGTFVTSFGSHAQGQGEYNYVAVDNSGVLYVCYYSKGIIMF